MQEGASILGFSPSPRCKTIYKNIYSRKNRTSNSTPVRILRAATGVVAAARKLNVKVPIVLRLEGTNVEEGRQILKESGLNFQMGATMKEAAELVVKAAAKA